VAEVKQYIFFDFEMLCSNRGMTFNNMEAIRLGAVKYELETESVAYFDMYIKPQHKKPLSRFCKKLTGITDEDLADAQDFKEVFQAFLTWVGGVKKSRFFSWSTSDLLRLKLDAERHMLHETTINKIEKRYVDFQGIFTKRVSKTNPSVENALAFYDLSFLGEKHNPMYDAFNTLRIYLSFQKNPVKSDLVMIRQFILEDLPESSEEINKKLKEQLAKDVAGYKKELSDIYKMKDAGKIVKRTRRLVEKYENVLINRSGIFTQEIKESINLLVVFYHDLLSCYEHHFNHSSKIMVLEDRITEPINELLLKRG
jgi:inhibitor of KinA sporulation pathway (predicted exonuclease)